MSTGAEEPFSRAYAFDHNAAGQRERITRSDGSYWQHFYDQLGQLENATQHLADGTPLDSRTFRFTYDDIGNRLTSRRGAASLAPSQYTPDALNQYGQIADAGLVWVTGEADPAAAVAVEGAPAARPGASRYFEHLVAVDNSAGAVFHAAEIRATLGGAEQGIDRYARVPPASFTPGYDEDGNLLADAFHAYRWDGENRLIRIESRADLPPEFPRYRVEFAYDAGGRRIGKTVSGKIGGGWHTASERRFLYDGWNLLAEYEASASGAWHPVSSYLWGSDLSGSLQGAGGTSGLLHLRDHIEGEGYFVAYDGKGNVDGLVSDLTGETAATYEYTPFGQLLAAAGPAANLNPFRFSTRYFDGETGLYYYGHRFLDPKIGRWLSRDPIGEQGGLNLHGMVGNDPTNRVDVLGLALYAFDGTNNDAGDNTNVRLLFQAYSGRAYYAPGPGAIHPELSESNCATCCWISEGAW